MGTTSPPIVPTHFQSSTPFRALAYAQNIKSDTYRLTRFAALWQFTCVAKPKPSAKLRSFIKAYGSVHACAMAWGVEYQALNRFLNGDCGLSLANAMQIASVTKVSVDDLFEQREKARK